MQPIILEPYYHQTEFTSIDFSNERLHSIEFDQCRFVSCRFSSAEIRQCQFSECSFVDCDLSLAKLPGSAVRDCVFERCKLMGIQWEACNAIGISFRFDACQMSHSSFYGIQAKKTVFHACILHACDFSNSDFSNSSFEKCDLLDARFMQSNLQNCRFQSAYHYRIHPPDNRLQKARFQMPEALGLLEGFGIQIE